MSKTKDDLRKAKQKLLREIRLLKKMVLQIERLLVKPIKKPKKKPEELRFNRNGVIHKGNDHEVPPDQKIVEQVKHFIVDRCYETKRFAWTSNQWSQIFSRNLGLSVEKGEVIQACKELGIGVLLLKSKKEVAIGLSRKVYGLTGWRDLNFDHRSRLISYD